MFFVESEENLSICPNCGQQLVYHCRVNRALRDTTGIKKLYSIRILKCENKTCPATYHRELPDIIIPYRRYDAESIEEAIEHSNSDITVAVDQSTIYRWRKWFKRSELYIVMALLSVSAVIGEYTKISSLVNEKQKGSAPKEKIQSIVGRKIKWLSEAVRILVNASKWKINRSAFLTG